RLGECGRRARVQSPGRERPARRLDDRPHPRRPGRRREAVGMTDDLPRLEGLSEPAKYERLVEQTPDVWWSDEGPFVGLHELNGARVQYFRGVFGGFRGKRVLDVGCGGGIL